MSEFSSSSLPATARTDAPSRSGVHLDPAVVVDRCHGALLGAVLGEAAGLAARGADVEVTTDAITHAPGPLATLILTSVRSHLDGAPLPGPDSQASWVASCVHGLWMPCEPLEPLALAAAKETSERHPSTVHTAASAALAVLLSAAVRGVIDRAVMPLAMGGADAGRAVGSYRCGPDVSSRIRWADALASGAEASMTPDLVELLIGTSRAPQEVVPAALVLSAVGDDPWEACRVAAERGGDADVVACVTGLIAGARAGAAAFPSPVVERLHRDHPHLGLRQLADEAAAHRSGPERPPLPTMAEVKAGRA